MSQDPNDRHPVVPTPIPARPGLFADLWKRRLDRRDLEHWTDQQLRIIHAQQHETPEGRQTLAMQYENDQLLEAMRQQGVISQAIYQAAKELLVALLNSEQANVARRETQAHELTMANTRYAAERSSRTDDFEKELALLEMKYKYESSPAVKDRINDEIEYLRGRLRMTRMIQEESRDDNEAELLYRFMQRIEDVTGRERRRS